MSNMLRRRAVLAGGLLAASFGAAARAQSWPDRPIRLIVPFAAGGTTDILGRIVAEHLGETWGQPVLVDNKAGAAGNIGAEAAARATPDGYTLMFAPVGIAVVNQYLYKNPGYDALRSFTPIALVGEVANVLVVHPSFPVKTFAEFIAYGKAKAPERISFGSPSLGGTGHLGMELVSLHTGLKFEHVVYKGSGPVVKDLIVGHIPCAMDNLPPYLPHIQSGALRALAVTSSKRWFAAPDIPTFGELGYPDLEAAPWWYIAAPAGTPPAIVKKIGDEVVRGCGREAVIRRMHAAGVTEAPGNAEVLAKRWVAEDAKWRKTIEAAGLDKQ
jgi:tripartite-type tricarboxylate transporter receptor subunit TctC